MNEIIIELLRSLVHSQASREYARREIVDLAFQAAMRSNLQIRSLSTFISAIDRELRNMVLYGNAMRTRRGFYSFGDAESLKLVALVYPESVRIENDSPRSGSELAYFIDSPLAERISSLSRNALPQSFRDWVNDFQLLCINDSEKSNLDKSQDYAP